MKNSAPKVLKSKISWSYRSNKSWQKELDDLTRRAARQRDHERCVRCGRTERLNVHHLYRKGRYTRLRHDLDNVITLCFYHHQEAHRDGLEFSEWFKEKYPKRADYLRLRSQVFDKTKPDFNAIKLYLTICLESA